MLDFSGSKTQRANKYAGLRATQTPPPGLQPGLHRKTSFCFSASTCRQDSHTIHFAPAGNGLSPTAGRHLSGLILYRALHFTVITASLPATAGQQLFGAYLLQPGLHHKTTFCFSASTCRQDSQARHFATAGKLLYGHIRSTPFRPDSLQSTTLSGPNSLPPGASRPTTFRRISFHTSPHSL